MRITPRSGLFLLLIAACGCGEETERDCSDFDHVLHPLTRPPQVVHVEVRGATDSSLVLVWTSFGDPCTHEPAGAFEIRMGPDRATVVAWDEATPLVRVTAPRGSGSREYYRLGGLQPRRDYHFALRAVYADLGRYSETFFHGTTTACVTAPVQTSPLFRRRIGLPDLRSVIGSGPLPMDGDPAGNLYYSTGRTVRKVSPEGAVLAQIGGVEREADAAAITFGLDGRLYVREWGGRTLKYSPEGSYLGTIIESEADAGRAWGQSFAVDSRGQMFTASLFPDLIRMYSPDGLLLAAWGPGGRSLPGGFHPGALAVDFNGGVYVADRYEGLIYRFTSDGLRLGSLGRPGGCPGEFAPITDLRFGWDGALYTLEQEESRVQKIATDGSPLAAWGSPGLGPGEFEVPMSLAVGSGRTIYVFDNPYDEGDSQIHVFEAEALASN